MAEFALAESVHHDIYPFISPAHALKGDAEGRTILITGAGTGIGKAIAEAFAQASAQKVVVVGRRLDVLENVKSDLSSKYPDCKVIAESCDVSDGMALEKLFAKLKEQSMEVDVLVNNAGVNTDRNTIKDSDVDGWWRAYEIMLKGPFMMTRAFLRARTRDSPAAVIMTSSIGSYNTAPGYSSYQSVKSALNRITERIANENKDQRVQAIAFHPGGVANTDLTSKSPDWMQQYYTETAELGAGTCVYLASPQAAYLSGRYVDATWDLEELEKSKSRIESENLLKMSMLGATRMKM